MVRDRVSKYSVPQPVTRLRRGVFARALHVLRIQFPAVVLGLAMSVHTLANSAQLAAPKGWTDTIEGDQRVVRRGNTAVRIGPWTDLAGESVDDWLARMASAAPPGGELVSERAVKREKRTGGYSVSKKVRFDDGEGQAVWYACPGMEGSARLIQMVSRGDGIGNLWSGGMFVERVCLKEPKTVATAVATSSAAPPAENIPQSTNPPPASVDSEPVLTVAAPPGLKELRGVLVMGLQAGGMFGLTDDFIALFEDGTWTSDLARTFQEGAAESRAVKPKRWGQWRLRDGELELKDHNDPEFEGDQGDWVLNSGSSDERLDGCYGSLRSSDGGGVGSARVGQARTWCFRPDGRFSNSSTGFGSSGNVTVSSRRAKLGGRYRIDGYTAVFLYDDGRELRAAFAYANEGRNHVMINGRRFMGR